MTDIISAIAAGALQLTALDIGDEPLRTTAALSYDGVSRNVERFYKPENTNVVIGANFKANSNTMYSFRIDTGHDTDKYDEEGSITLGITKRHYLDEHKMHSFVWSAANMLGGDIRHTPCYDSFNRQYYCKTLTAWSDYKPEDNDTYSASVKYKWRW